MQIRKLVALTAVYLFIFFLVSRRMFLIGFVLVLQCRNNWPYSYFSFISDIVLFYLTVLRSADAKIKP